MKNRRLIRLVYLIICCFLYFIAGILFHIVYIDFKEATFNNNFNLSDFVRSNYSNLLDGLWMKNMTGDWVCVNIKDMSYERALEVCSHEVGHEIFAEKCEKNPQLCFDLADTIENLQRK